MEGQSLNPRFLLEHTAFVRTVARAVLGADDEIEDVVQDTWTAALAGAPRDAGRMRAWLGGIARRQAWMTIRRRARSKRRLEQLSERGQGDTPDTARAAESAETGRRVVGAVLALPPIYRDVVLLRYFEEQPPRRVASRLGVPVNTVRTRTRRALVLLREGLAETGRGEHPLAALLPLAGFPAGRAATAVTGGILAGTSTVLPLVALLCCLVLGAVVWRATHGPSDGEETRSGSAPATTPLEAPPATLAGSAAQATTTPSVPRGGRLSEEAFLDLARRVSYPEARDLLVAWSREDETVASRLVEWLHPRHDATRFKSQHDGKTRSGGWPTILRAFEALAHVGPTTVPLLAERLDDPNRHVRERAVHALAYQMSAAVPALPALLRHAKDPDLEGHVLGALGVMGRGASEALPAFLDCLRDEARTEKARAAAARGVLYIAEPSKVVFDTCTAVLRGGEYETARVLLQQIENIGPPCAPLAGELRALVLDPATHDHVRVDAMHALRRVEEGEATRSALLRVAAAREFTNEARAGAFLALARLGPEAHDALGRLAADLDDDERLLLASAVGEAVGEKRLPAAFPLRVLNPVRRAQDPRQRRDAIVAAERFVWGGREEIAWLGRWLEDEDPLIRVRALRALRWLPEDDGASLDVLFDAIADPDPHVRKAALELIGGRARRFGAVEGDARERRLEQVLHRTRDPDPGVRQEAAIVVRDLAPERSREFTGIWIEMLGHEWPDRAILAAEALEQLGPDASEAAGPLRNAVEKATWAPLRRAFEKALEAVERR